MWPVSVVLKNCNMKQEEKHFLPYSVKSLVRYPLERVIFYDFQRILVIYISQIIIDVRISTLLHMKDIGPVFSYCIIHILYFSSWLTNDILVMGLISSLL